MLQTTDLEADPDADVSHSSAVSSQLSLQTGDWRAAPGAKVKSKSEAVIPETLYLRNFFFKCRTFSPGEIPPQWKLLFGPQSGPKICSLNVGGFSQMLGLISPCPVSVYVLSCTIICIISCLFYVTYIYICLKPGLKSALKGWISLQSYHACSAFWYMYIHTHMI